MHTYARLRGFGLTVVPFAPYCIRRIGDGADDRISVEHGELSALLDPHRPDSAGSFASVAEVSREESGASWSVEFGGFTASWPNRFALASSDLEGVPFELWGELGASILVQGPFSPPPAEAQMTAPGHTVVNRGTSPGDVRWLELHYATPDGLAWAQRYYTLPTSGFLIEAQARRGHEPSVMPMAERLAGEMLEAR